MRLRFLTLTYRAELRKAAQTLKSVCDCVTFMCINRIGLTCFKSDSTLFSTRKVLLEVNIFGMEFPLLNKHLQSRLVDKIEWLDYIQDLTCQRQDPINKKGWFYLTQANESEQCSHCLSRFRPRDFFLRTDLPDEKLCLYDCGHIASHRYLGKGLLIMNIYE